MFTVIACPPEGCCPWTETVCLVTGRQSHVLSYVGLQGQAGTVTTITSSGLVTPVMPVRCFQGEKRQAEERWGEPEISGGEGRRKKQEEGKGDNGRHLGNPGSPSEFSCLSQ